MENAINYLYSIDKWFNSLFIVTEEELEKSKTSDWVSFKVFLKQNRRVIALVCIIILLIIDFDLLNLFPNSQNDATSNPITKKSMWGGSFKAGFEAATGKKTYLSRASDRAASASFSKNSFKKGLGKRMGKAS